MTTETPIGYADRLREKGLRATSQRLELLRVLDKAKMPMGIAELQEEYGSKNIDTATFYRGLETLADASLVRRVNLRHGHMDYELSREGDHHHHIVCTECGDVEDFDWCPDDKLRNQILKRTNRFSSLTDHALEFFGTCKKCS